MRRLTDLPRRNRHGSTLVLTLIMMVILSALAVAMAGMSGTNVQIADNYRKLDVARASAESGQDVLRYWMKGISFTGVTAPAQRFDTLAAVLQNNLAAASITNIIPVLSGMTISIANVPLNSDQSFSAVLYKLSDNEVRVDVTGHYRGIGRTLRSKYYYDIRADNVFDYGLASVGRMYLRGNLDIESYNELQVEANAFIFSPSDTVALQMEGKAMIGGTVTFTDTTRTAIISNAAGIGGQRGAQAYKNIFYSDVYCEFPEMHPELFWGYATKLLTTPTPAGGTWDNIRIPAGLNPTFSGSANLRGVILVESPNVVTFGGGTTITGIIVTNGNSTFDPDPNDPTAPRLTFGSNVNSFSSIQLPADDPNFAPFRETADGSFILAPGFRVEFTGTFGTLSGAIGANGIKIGGGTGGVINGSLINYADNMMELSGNGSLLFNRSGMTQVPAGFVPQTILRYDPLSYAEISL